jgi:hypothetical protein
MFRMPSGDGKLKHIIAAFAKSGPFSSVGLKIR